MSGELPAFAAAPSDFSRMLRQAAIFISRRRVVVETPAEASQVLLISRDEAQKSLRHVPVARAANEQMLGAETLGRLGQHSGCPNCSQSIAAKPQRRIRGNPRERIRPAAVQPQDNFDAGISVRCSAAALSMRSWISRRAASRAPRVPPLDCSVMPTRRELRGAFGPK